MSFGIPLRDIKLDYAIVLFWRIEDLRRDLESPLHVINQKVETLQSNFMHTVHHMNVSIFLLILGLKSIPRLATR